MRFFQVVFSGAALINAAMAAVSFTSVPTSVQAGQSVELTWEATGSGPVTILLRRGPAENLGPGQTLTTTGANGRFTWAVPASLVNGNDYAFEIVQGSDNNFSGQFAVAGGTGQASSAPVSSVSATSAPLSSSGPPATATVSASVTVSVPLSTGVSSALTLSSSASTNATISSATLSRTASTSARPTGNVTNTANIPESTGGASTLITSPLALIFGAIAAMAYLN